MIRRQGRRALVGAALAAAACGEVRPLRKPGLAPPVAPGGSYELAPGYVIGRDGRTLYAASGDGRVVALDIVTGAERWISGEAAHPLLLTPLGLLAVRDSEGQPERLDLALLDAKSGGVARGCEPVRTATWVKAHLTPADDMDFVVRARSSIEGLPVVEWRARSKVPIAGVAPPPDAGVGALPEAAGWGVIDPGTCGVLEVGPLAADAPAFEPPALGPVQHDAVIAEVVLAPGPSGRGVVAAIRRRRGRETLPDVPLAADAVGVDPIVVWSADRGHASLAAAEPSRPGTGLRWTIVGVDDGARLATMLVPAAPRGFAVTAFAIVVVFPDRLAGFDLTGASVWVRPLGAATPR